MREDVALDPIAECAIVRDRGAESRVFPRDSLVRRRNKKRGEALDLLVGNGCEPALQALPLGFDVLREDREGHFLDQDLDPRLVHVVAASKAVVDAQDRVEIVEYFLPRQEFANHMADDRCASEPAADQHAKSDLAGLVAHRVHADIVDERRGAIDRRPAHCNLEFPRQIGEFGVKRRPLAEELGVGAGIDDLVAGNAREMIGGDVAHAISAGLDGVHLHAGELGQDVGDVLQPRPVELDVLARSEVAVTSVILPADVRQLSKLPGRKKAIGNGDTQHRRILLDVQPVLQPQRSKLVFGQFAREKTARLVAKLGDALVHQTLVMAVVLIHGDQAIQAWISREGMDCAYLIASGYMALS